MSVALISIIAGIAAPVIAILGTLIIIFGYLRWRRREVNKKELQALRGDIAQMRVEIEDMKEQIADLTIKMN